MNITLKQYLKTCSNDALYKLFDDVIAEMNRRKEKEEKEEKEEKACNFFKCAPGEVIFKPIKEAKLIRG